MSDDGSESSPARPVRRIRKVMVVSSGSGSDSDDSVAPRGTRSKRLRVLSDDGSDSSGSSVVARRRRTLRALRDSDADSDSSGSASDAVVPKPASGFTSDSSEGNSDKCSICLLRFKDQEVGIPETCEHVFCLDCITEWSKNVNTCPVDRMTFNSIVVRACAGGRVLRTELVKLTERRPSVDVLVVEEPTPCEVCGRTDNEESMLLCDGCDLGYHMQCLTPPLTEIPLDQWLCPNCDDLLDVIHISELDDLFTGIIDLGPRAAPLRRPRNVPTSARTRSSAEEPSTSSGRRGAPASGEAPSTSRGRAPRSIARSSRTTSAATTRRRAAPTRRKYKRRRTKTVIIEYDVEENGKFPITKTVKRRVKKRKSRKKQPRTVARRSHVRASVRAQLAALSVATRAGPVSAGGGGALGLATRRARAGVPALSLLGDPHALDYFSDEERGAAEGAAVAVAARPAGGAALLSAYRQARRKMVSLPPAAAAPDLLDSIMESQTRLHSRRSVVSVGVDGRLDISLEPPERAPAAPRSALPQGEDAARKAPAYPGQGRSGGWGGGYRGDYHREHGTGNFSRGGYDYSTPRARAPAPFPQGGARRDHEPPAVFHRAPRYSAEPCERRRPPEARPARGRFTPGAPWPPPGPRYDAPPPPHTRHSFGGFEAALDMRAHRPLPAPPSFQFTALPDAGDRDDRDQNDRDQDSRDRDERDQDEHHQDMRGHDDRDQDECNQDEHDEDERDEDAGLVIDTDKYDPTEPTIDDEDSADDAPPATVSAPPSPPPSPSPPPVPALPAPPLPPPLMQNILAGMEALHVPPGVLDDAVRQVLQEHRGLMSPTCGAGARVSDEDEDGDCPNFSIYSATSVHIASDDYLPAAQPAPPTPDRRDEDLVQQDDEPASPPAPPPLPPPPLPPLEPAEAAARSREDEYKEKISKRCPITTNTRNPIKIKLNTPSLIKRQVSLYDEEEAVEPVAPNEPAVAAGDDASPRRSDPGAEAGDTRAADESRDDDEDGGGDEEELVQAITPDGEREPSTEREGSPDTPAGSAEAGEDALEAAEDAGSAPEPAGERAAGEMTESISETEDERSYTPCLDENKSKDASLEAPDIAGLGTELISDEEGCDMFSDGERSPAVAAAAAAAAAASPRDTPPPAGDPLAPADDGKKKKKKDSKKETKEKGKGKSKKSDVAFKKLSKSGKERNYRERDKDDKRGKKEKERAAGARRRDRRQDLERYDVRSVVTDKRRKVKDAFGRDVSPPSPARASPASAASSPRAASPRRRRRRASSPRRDPSPAPPRLRLTPRRKSVSPRRKSISPRRRSITPRRKSISPRRKSISPQRRKSISPRRKSASPRRRSGSRVRKPSPRRRRSVSRARKRARRSASRSPKPKATKKKKLPTSRPRSPRRKSPKRKRAKRMSPSPSPSPARAACAGALAWSPPSVDSHLLSPRTPPPDALLAEERRARRERRRRAAEPPPAAPPQLARMRHKRGRDASGPSKEVFTSGDNILVSVSFKDQEHDHDGGEKRKRKETRREKRRKRRRAAAAAVEADAAKPIAIIDLERSPFRELTPSPKNVIVLSDSEHGEAEPERAPAPAAPAAEPVGPKTPPEPAAAAVPRAPDPPVEPPRAAPAGPSTPPDSPDAYDPFEPTRSPSASPAPPPAPPAEPPRTMMTLETAQKTNMSADDVLDRRPVSPMEKVLALLQSTRDVSPEPPPPPHQQPAPAEPPPAALPPPAAPAPAAPAPAAAVAPPVRIVLPSPTRAAPPKLFLAKPSPIKSNPVKPMQATKISRLPLPPPRRAPPEAQLSPGADSPYSPGSSDFGDLFSPPPHAHALASAPAGKRPRNTFDALFDKPPRRRTRASAAKVPVKLNKKKGNKTQVGVKIDEDNLKILDDLPSSAVEMQVKSKFLKKLNRQERVVEEVKLVLKPHYNKKHVTKDEYKHILRRTVPKICHNKTGEINPTKIQSLVEAYVKKFRKKHKLGLA